MDLITAKAQQKKASENYSIIEYYMIIFLDICIYLYAHVRRDLDLEIKGEYSYDVPQI